MRSAYLTGPLACAVLLATATVHAQGRPVTGLVTDSAGVGVAFARILLTAGRDTVAFDADSTGAFRLEWQPRWGHALLRVTRIGFSPSERTLDRAALDAPLRIVLAPLAAQVASVTVRGAAVIDELREGTFAVGVVDATDVALRTRSANDAVDRVAGVRVRQAGGEGSPALLSIHGLSGNQVRLFVDGLPQEFLGPAGQLAGLSVSTVERIEVYKGVVPVELGGDALGGALNVVSGAGTGGHVAVGTGSYGAANADVAMRHAGTGWTAAVDAGYRGARNDYPIDAITLDEFSQPVPVRVRRFHDRYGSVRGGASAAITGRRWADTLRLRVFGGREDRELQHAPIMAQPFGDAETSATAGGAVLSWSATARGSRAGIEFGHSLVDSRFVDTTLAVYDWTGRVLRQRDYGGEISSSRNLLTMRSRHLLARAHVGVPVGPGTLRAHLMRLSTDRDGRDSIAAEYYGQDPFRHPTALSRMVLGLGYGAQVGAGLRLDLGVKRYRYMARGFAIERGTFVPYPTQRRGNTGGLAGVGVPIGRAWRAKASFEVATRMPEAQEVLGDFALVRPNPALRPERSRNVNLGVQWAQGTWWAEVTGFHRHTSDIVFLRVSQFYALHENLLEARARGVEVTFGGRVTPRVSIDASATFQDVRNRSPQGVSSAVADRYHNARLPNIPVFFAHSRLSVHVPYVATGRTLAWWDVRYVAPFFLHWEIDGRRDSKATIPEQRVHGLGLTHALVGERVRLNLEMQNAFDARVFDVFSVPRPGRTLHAHVRATLW